MIGPYEVLVLILLGASLVWPACRICSRAGFPAALGLLAIVPVANLVLLYALAIVDWPALRQPADRE